MATHRRPKQPSRARVSVLTAAAATAVALSANASAHAAPAQPSKDEVKVQIDQLNTEQEQAAEKFNGAQERADQLRKQADQLQDQVARGQDQLTQLQNSLSAVAGEQYRSGGIDPTVALMLSANPDGYLEQASSAEQVNQTEADILKALKEQQARLDQQKQEAATVLAELDRNTKDLNDAKAQVQQKLQDATNLLNTLTAQERAAVVAADRASRGDSRADLGPLPSAGGYAGVAVAAALNKRGSDYVWGAEGPSTFDCSGLMQWAYAQAGVSLPRTSQEQASVGTKVPSLAQAQPGDLVIYGNDAHHVGMYIGNGMVVHAPHTGDVVRTMQADAMSILTIRRV
ncbi:NlpC/P60 family protein [Kitasatospora sp. NPDC056138]|uniref:C40 family peptidase n=1 Tax=Kitasatospora sp. NPDC056138 TaxID=3345724 RepID=UPI0035DAB883